MKYDWEYENTLNDSAIGRCFSPINIALAKYWGKRDSELNLPQNTSLSVTLDELGSFTTVEFNKTFKEDIAVFNGLRFLPSHGSFSLKITAVLDELRAKAGVTTRARVQTRNNFPTGAGLASSASGLSAVAFAGAAALGLKISREELSTLARKGSGSASRSLFGGFVEWSRGAMKDGTDSRATQLAPATHWPLYALVAVFQEENKKDPSTQAMELTRSTSPYFDSWVRHAEEQIGPMREAILARDFLKLAGLAEANCLRMHAAALSAFPPLLYWEPGTISLMKKVWRLRDLGHHLFFTIDAGPNVIIFYEASPKKSETETEKAIIQSLKQIPVISLLRTRLGDGPAHVH